MTVKTRDPIDLPVLGWPTAAAIEALQSEAVPADANAFLPVRGASAQLWRKQPAMPSKPPSKSPNKNELRTKETRELLLRSAETVFVRDGYESAELGEIAALAGRTKGAIYAQFEGKEALFLALFAERMRHSSEKMYEHLAHTTGPAENLAAFRSFYANSLKDRNWALLLLEFKLFAIRHPESKEKMLKLRKELLPESYKEQEYAKYFGSESMAGSSGKSLPRSAAVTTLGPILSALVVESLFEPALLDEPILTEIVTRLFDALLPPLES